METIYSPSTWTFRSREYLGTNHLNYGFWIDDINDDPDKQSSRRRRNRDLKTEYSTSHTRLLHKLLEFIDFQIDRENADKNVLFVACGCGHEVLAFARYVAGQEAPAPTTRSRWREHVKNGNYNIIGLEFVESQVACAKELISLSGSTSPLPQSDSISITIIQGDACGLSNHIDSESISTLICLDAAYHFFPSRLTFLHQAFKVLSSTSPSSSSSSSSSTQSLRLTKLGLVDFIFPCTDSLLLPFYLPILSFLHLAGIPFQNQVSLPLYRSCLIQAGFTNIKTFVISQQVFPGFKKHVLQAFSQRTIEQPLFTWFPLIAFAYMMDLLYRLRVIDSILVSANKP